MTFLLFHVIQNVVKSRIRSDIMFRDRLPLSLTFVLTFVAAVLLFTFDVRGQSAKDREMAAFGELKARFGDRLKLGKSRATGKINFVRIEAEDHGNLSADSSEASLQRETIEFLRSYGMIFGIQNVETDLTFEKEQTDDIGNSHINFAQTYQGLPVFGGTLKAHFNAKGELRAVNGTIVPKIDLDVIPTQRIDDAISTAVSTVASVDVKTAGLYVASSDLMVYRDGLVRGMSGVDHLVWKLEVSNGGEVREFVFVDAHSGAIVDQITGRYDAMDRRLFSSNGTNLFPPTSYPILPFWAENATFPTGNSGADEIIRTSADTYNLYKNGFGRDSYDDSGGPLISFFNFGHGFDGNAFQYYVGGQPVTSFGNDFITDDVVAHEITHTYTAYTDNLVFDWQPGALNESYSDIFGETVDILNGRGLDTPGDRRNGTANLCSAFTRRHPILTVNAPAVIAGNYEAAYNSFGPAVTSAGTTGNIVLVNDGVGNTADGCTTPFANASAVNGKIALIEANASTDVGCYGFTRVLNAQQNGAIGVVVAFDAELGNRLQPFFGPNAVIPSINVGYNTGQLLRNQIGAGVNVRFFIDPTAAADNTHRWELGEGTVAYGEAIRDMWNPKCTFAPGKVSDLEYDCIDPGDYGGIHTNSGIPNHTYALLVDGGTFNGRTVNGIGLTKAAQIYYRAMAFYQNPVTNFPDHAEAIEAAANDLIGVNLRDLVTGLPSGEIINAADISQVHAATLATELRNDPVQCGFPVVTVSGRVVDPSGRGLRSVTVTITDAKSVQRTATTSSFGFYSFDSVPSGQSITVKVSSRLYRFAPQTLAIYGNLTNVDFMGIE